MGTKISAKHLLLLILLAALALRLNDVGRDLNGEEQVWYNASLSLFKGNLGGALTVHPPLGLYSFTLEWMLGINNLRMVPMLAGILTIFVAYLISREFLDEKTSLVAALLLALSNYHILQSQLLDVDGGILTLFALCSYYFLVKYYSTEKQSKLLLAASTFFMLLAFLSKISALIFLFPAAVFIFATERNWRDRAIAFAPFILALLLFFPCWIFLDKLTGINSLGNSFSHASEFVQSVSLQERVLYKALDAARIAARLTAFLPLLALAVLLKNLSPKKIYEKPVLALMFAWLLVAFGLFAITVTGEQLRYFAIALPPLMIICASATEGVDLKQAVKRNKEALIFFGVPLFGLFIAALLDFNEAALHLLAILIPIQLALALISLKFLEFKTAAASILLGYLIFSAFMLIGARSYDEMRSEAIAGMAKSAQELNHTKIVVLRESIELYTPKSIQVIPVRSKFYGGGINLTEATKESPYVYHEPLLSDSTPPWLSSKFWVATVYWQLESECVKLKEQKSHGTVIYAVYDCSKLKNNGSN
ncbi:Dolichyl-phosphate-mannose-protein mannosyltransferase [Candidatus Gugararchaeum adminiculabundum]|nr:Dolichyl-phosphate-mannose-protein mannosyltransferase [Candidatus Gugararchaeum adminiculabundum]